MTTSLASRRLMSGLHRIRAALDAADYPLLEDQMGEYASALQACFANGTTELSIEECHALQEQHDALQARMRNLRDEAAAWLRQQRHANQAIQAYTGVRRRRLPVR